MSVETELPGCRIPFARIDKGRMGSTGVLALLPLSRIDLHCSIVQLGMMQSCHICKKVVSLSQQRLVFAPFDAVGIYFELCNAHSHPFNVCCSS